MRRRGFITLLSGAVLTWPLVANAEQADKPAGVPVIGLLFGASDSGIWTQLEVAFRQGLNEAGYAEGRNVVIEARWANGHYDRLPALATDLIQHRVA